MSENFSQLFSLLNSQLEGGWDRHLDAISVESTREQLLDVIVSVEKTLQRRASNYGFIDAPISSIEHGPFVYVVANPLIQDFDADGRPFKRPNLCAREIRIDVVAEDGATKVVASGGLYPIRLRWLCARIKITD